MDPYPYLKGFAWLALIALGLSVFSGFWVPMLIGAVATWIAVMMFRKTNG